MSVQRWVEEQRRLASALGLELSEWSERLEAAGGRRTELMAAVVGASAARKLGLAWVSGIDGEALAVRARALLGTDAAQPKLRHPVLAAAVARDALRAGAGASQLRARVEPPKRGGGSLGPSAALGTPDAPGEA